MSKLSLDLPTGSPVSDLAFSLVSSTRWSVVCAALTMSLFDNLLRKLAEFLVVLQMFLMASCWPTPLDEYEEDPAFDEATEVEGDDSRSEGPDLRRRAQLGTVNG